LFDVFARALAAELAPIARRDGERTPDRDGISVSTLDEIVAHAYC